MKLIILIAVVLCLTAFAGAQAVPVGTAGTPSPAVVSVQGVTGGTSIPVTLAPAAAGTYTDRSSTITLGGTAQTLAVANASRKQIIIENPCNATEQGIATAENLAINFTSAASISGGGSITLLPCGSFTFPVDSVSTELISVVATTTGHKFTAKEM